MPSVFTGTLELKATKDGRRYLTGWDGKLPILGYEDKKKKNKFYVKPDSKKLQWMEAQDSKKADKADVVHEE